jgi:prophage tail gpP-like protein
VRCALNDGKQPLLSDRSEGRLKDERINTRFLDERKELVFDEHASITSYFESAVKCWRINQPTVIMIENQGLTDEHCMILCNFLKDKNMINELNLRRNKITNKGAIAIADLIVNHDK